MIATRTKPIILRIEIATVLKSKPIQSSELPEDLKQSIEAGKELELESYAIERDHYRCVFAKDTFKGTNVWYVFSKHVKIYNEQTAIPKVLPKSVKLPIPYKSQRDNELNPDGSCNVTSLAMCLAFLGATRQEQEGQFEDELYDYALRQDYSRHEPADLARIVQDYGCRDDFRKDATIDQVKAWLADGKPVVIHGYFTNFGHIVVVTGYDENGFFVHDPFGEWFWWGYDRNDPEGNNHKGESLHYSYNMIRRLCIPDGNFWVHFISKR